MPWVWANPPNHVPALLSHETSLSAVQSSLEILTVVIMVRVSTNEFTSTIIASSVASHQPTTAHAIPFSGGDGGIRTLT